MSKNNIKKSIVIWFLSIPFAASIISMVHIVSFFEIGNVGWMAIVLAITFEVGAMASLVSFSVIHELKSGKYSIYFVFIILFLMQMIGNVYYSFDYVTKMVIEDANWIVVFKEFLDITVGLFTDELPSPSHTKYILSCVIGMPVPLISLSFIHSLVKYLEKKEPKTGEAQIVDGNLNKPWNMRKSEENSQRDDLSNGDTNGDINSDTNSGVIVEH